MLPEEERVKALNELGNNPELPDQSWRNFT
jgi:hypothetical protein